MILYSLHHRPCDDFLKHERRAHAHKIFLCVLMKMMDEREQARLRTLEYLEKAHVYLKEDEKKEIEIADMGLGMQNQIGIQIFVYLNAPDCSAKELILFPGQICPEQLHPTREGKLGKHETFRVRYGELYVYLEGEPVNKEKMWAKIPVRKEDTFTVFHEIKLEKGDMLTIPRDTKHWICGGPNGCVVSEFAPFNSDDYDVYTDPAIARMSGVSQRKIII